MEWKYNEKRNRIIVEPPKRHKKVTAHRFSSVLGLNEYQSGFGAWCEIMGLVKLPFEDNKYTIFGKVVEPKMIDFVREKFPNVMSTEEYYGNSFKEYQYSNYKDLNSIYDGVRDFVCTKNDKKTITMVGECKGASNPAKWANGNIPMDYLCQLCLYLYLDELKKGLFVTTFPSAMDYNNPENYKVTEDNTKLTVVNLDKVLLPLPHDKPSTDDEFKGDWTTNDTRFGGIQDAIDYGELWWKTYVESGISPKFDEKRDKEYLDIIRASKPTNDNDLITVCAEAIRLAKEIKDDLITTGIDAKQKELKVLEKNIKDKMIETNIDNCGSYKLKQKLETKFNEKAFAEKHEKLYNSYCEETITYTLSKNLKGDE